MVSIYYVVLVYVYYVVNTKIREILHMLGMGTGKTYNIKVDKPFEISKVLK